MEQESQELQVNASVVISIARVVDDLRDGEITAVTGRFRGWSTILARHIENRPSLEQYVVDRVAVKFATVTLLVEVVEETVDKLMEKHKTIICA